MSKGINTFNHFYPPKADGHKMIGYFRIYCPIINDQTSAQHTSNGVMCKHCNKHVRL